MSKPLAMMVVGAMLLLGIAVALYYELSEEKPASIISKEIALEQGILFFDQKKYPEALKELEKIPASKVNDWRIPYYIGSSQMMLKEYQLAADSLEQALVLNNQQTGVLYALGVAYYKMGNLKLAKAYFAAVLEINPADGQAKGLMETMADLERQQPGETPEDSAQNDVNGENNH